MNIMNKHILKFYDELLFIPFAKMNAVDVHAIYHSNDTID